MRIPFQGGSGYLQMGVKTGDIFLVGVALAPLTSVSLSGKTSMGGDCWTHLPIDGRHHFFIVLVFPVKPLRIIPDDKTWSRR